MLPVEFRMWLWIWNIWLPAGIVNDGRLRARIVRKTEPAWSFQRGLIQLDGTAALSAISRKLPQHRNTGHGRKPGRSPFRRPRYGRLRLGLFLAAASITSLFRRLHSFMVSLQFRNSSAIAQSAIAVLFFFLLLLLLFLFGYRFNIDSLRLSIDLRMALLLVLLRTWAAIHPHLMVCGANVNPQLGNLKCRKWKGRNRGGLVTASFFPRFLLEFRKCGVVVKNDTVEPRLCYASVCNQPIAVCDKLGNCATTGDMFAAASGPAELRNCGIGELNVQHRRRLFQRVPLLFARWAKPAFN